MSAASNDAAKGEGGEKELAILFPNGQQTIAGRALVMREYGFEEQLRYAAHIASIVQAMAGVALNQDLEDLDSLRQVLADHHHRVLDLIAVSCDQDREWVAAVKGTDGENLLLLWWAVNHHFFLHRVLTKVQLVLLRKVGARDGQTSSPPSSMQATIRGASGSIPSGN